MPRFTEKEKAFISDKLLAEGEKLFSLHGLKKVTVDDLAVAANISKGSFYAFYPSKEHLYIEINFQLQQKLFENIETVVKKKHYPTQKALTKDVIMMSLTGIITSPILSQIDLSIMDYLQRKLSLIFSVIICTMISAYWKCCSKWEYSLPFLILY